MDRREFIKKSLKGAGAVMLTPFLLPVKLEAQVKQNVGNFLENTVQKSLAEEIGVNEIITNEEKFGIYRVNDKFGTQFEKVLFVYLDSEKPKSLIFFADEIIAKICTMSVYVNKIEIEKILKMEADRETIKLGLVEYQEVIKKLV